MSREISPRTDRSACARFTPSKSGQRSPPTYYRGCWHVVSRGLFARYRQIFVPRKRSLQPEGLLPPRGVAASGFRPLRKIPCCCLPQESGPCLSPSVADHPLRPAMDRRLGRPLPHQPANPPQAPPKAPEGFGPWTVCGISLRFRRLSPTSGQVPTCYSPVRRFPPAEAGFVARLACIRHAASVYPEPGSNSPLDFSALSGAAYRSFECRECRTFPVHRQAPGGHEGAPKPASAQD